MKKILMVEDDPIIHKLVQAALKSDFEVAACFSISECTALLESSPELELMIIDRSLPDGDGLSLCAQIRNMDQYSALPIIFLSARDSESDKVSGLFAGADDYMTKPFSPLELRARVAARLRHVSQKIIIGDLELDQETHRVHRRDSSGRHEVSLTPIEFKMLSIFMQSVGKVIHRESLLTKVWGHNCNIGDRVVDTHISHLRKKVSDCGLSLESVRGEGYRLVKSTGTESKPA